jgi:hypothetical protein
LLSVAADEDPQRQNDFHTASAEAAEAEHNLRGAEFGSLPLVQCNMNAESTAEGPAAGSSHNCDAEPRAPVCCTLSAANVHTG